MFLKKYRGFCFEENNMGNTITVASGQTLSHIAAKYGVSVEELKQANNIDNADNVKAGQKITIPLGRQIPEKTNTSSNENYSYERQKLHYMDIKISDKQAKLTEAKTPVEKAKIQDEIKALKAKQARQKQIAKMELDENHDYILITVNKDINVEDLKKLFDIEDGAVKAHNKLDFKYMDYGDDVPTELEGRQYKDYTRNTIQKGQTIKVKPSEIDNQGSWKEFWNWALN